MTPQERAKRVITQEQVGRHYIVALTDNCWRILLDMSGSLPHSDQIALIARHILAKEFALDRAEEDTRIAAEVDERFFAGRIHYPSQVAELCRRFAELHIKSCISEWPSGLTKTTSKLFMP
jgi:hypothetical protein